MSQGLLGVPAVSVSLNLPLLHSGLVLKLALAGGKDRKTVELGVSV